MKKSLKHLIDVENKLTKILFLGIFINRMIFYGKSARLKLFLAI